MVVVVVVGVVVVVVVVVGGGTVVDVSVVVLYATTHIFNDASYTFPEAQHACPVHIEPLVIVDAHGLVASVPPEIVGAEFLSNAKLYSS